MTDNPFRPSFGSHPPVMVGREDVVLEFRSIFSERSWTPSRTSLVVGLRGIGKTVVLNAVEDEAREADWFVLSETAQPGLLQQLTGARLPRLLREVDPDGTRWRLTGGGIGSLGSVAGEVRDDHLPGQDLRDQLTILADIAAERGTGVLITIDEIHDRAIDDLRPIFVAVQHLQREERPVVFVGAGLPAALNAVLQDPGTTFLRRAHRIELDSLTRAEAQRALEQPIVDRGRAIDEAALDHAVLASRGYPFLVQAIGSYAWSAAEAEATITLEAAEAAALRAHRTMGSHIHRPSLAGLSNVDRTFLAAMAYDEGPSQLGSIATRMGVTPGYASVYRQRLIDAGLILGVSHGKVDFAIPYFRDHLREHAVAAAITTNPRDTFPAREPRLGRSQDAASDAEEQREQPSP